MTTPPDSAPTDARLPGWLAEALDVLGARRRAVVATAVGLLLLGAIVALLLPGVLPPRPIVGAAVGIAAALLATALALAMDASDLVVRGTRHVRAAGGTVDVRVSRQADDVGPLLAAVARHARDGQVRVALSAASRKAGVPGVRAAALAEALARTGRKVLLTDLTRGGSPAAGLSDVIAGTRTLPEVVRFEQDLYLARLAVGSDPDVALDGFAGWVDGLPDDLEVLVVALPPLAERGVVKAATALDCTLVLVEVDRTERVDLIASLDAADAAGLTSELVLVDPQRTDTTESAPAPAEPPAEEEIEAEIEPDAPTTDPTSESEVADEEVLSPADEPAAVDANDADTDTDAAVDDAEDDDLLAAIGLTDDAFDDGTVPVDGPPDPATEATPPWADADEALADAEADDRADRDTGEVAALLGGATAAAAGVGAFGAPVSAHDPEDERGGDVDDDRPGDATAEIAMPRPDEADVVDEDADDRLSHIWDEPAAAEPAPTPMADSPAAPTEPDGGAAGLDPAALEVARTSAALHQLAQQIWERES
jgi:hypothetical protein